jgi:hypothetical protein
MHIKCKKKLNKTVAVLSGIFLLGGLFYFISREEKFIVSENSPIEVSEKKPVVILDNSKDEKAQESEVLIEDNDADSNALLEAENKPEKVDDIPVDGDLSKKNDVIDNLVSWGFTYSSGRDIDTIIIHSSYNALGGEEYDTEKLIDEYRQYGVAAHYLIDRKGRIYQLVEDKNIAYHAGVSEVPDGRKNVNNFSVGIEIMNTKNDKYTDSQYESLNQLIERLKDKHTIKYILGHNEIAPGRKTDPWNMDWDKVHR